jgi:hypothetical protein
MWLVLVSRLLSQSLLLTSESSRACSEHVAAAVLRVPTVCVVFGGGQKEVFSGDGQWRCGNKACRSAQDLSSYEMNFVYTEHGEKKEALVKLRLCPECGHGSLP